jgi:hypothetical protein
VSSGAGGCLDRAAPLAHVAKTRAAALAGTTSDRGCGASGRGKVRSVWVAIGRRGAHSRCQFASGSGRLGHARRCSKQRYLLADGTARWSVRFAHALPRGRYVAWIRTRDATGNARTQTARFAVR